eukprot:537264_1
MPGTGWMTNIHSNHNVFISMLSSLLMHSNSQYYVINYGSHWLRLIYFINNILDENKCIKLTTKALQNREFTPLKLKNDIVNAKYKFYIQWDSKYFGILNDTVLNINNLLLKNMSFQSKDIWDFKHTVENQLIRHVDCDLMRPDD